jgi:OmpA-OmpF porin, OOP family
MSQFDQLIDEVATRFGLGDKAVAMVREVLALMTSSPGGLGGFIEKFASAGLGREVSTWLGSASPAAITPAQVEQALGSNTVSAIAQKVGIPGAAASAALGYVVPKLVGQLTPNGRIGSVIPSSVSELLRGAASVETPQVTPTLPSASAISAAAAKPARWIAPLVALLLLGGLSWYFLGDHSQAPQTAATSQTAAPSRLALTNDDGVVTYSGTVHDEATRNKIIDALKSAYGENAIKGNIAVDPNVAPMPWLANLRGALDQLKMPGIDAVFDGNGFNLGGTIGEADRDRILGSLKSVFGASGLTFAAADRMSSLVSAATNNAAAALAALGPGSRPADVLSILNKTIINFPSGSAEIPPMSLALLQEAATPLKQLPGGTVVEIGGYTDNTGDAAANQQLSQRRAEAVREALVKAGVNPGKIVAKGFGSSNPVASNDTPDGRFQNRRIEYSERQSQAEQSGKQ